MVVYRRNEFTVLKFRNTKKRNYFIIMNSNKDFNKGHTHVNNFYMCKKIINCLITKKIDRTFNHYMLTSMKRLNNDHDFEKVIKNEINKINHKTSC